MPSEVAIVYCSNNSEFPDRNYVVLNLWDNNALCSDIYCKKSDCTLRKLTKVKI